MKSCRRDGSREKRGCPLSLACPRESGQKEKDTREGNVSIHSPLWTHPFQRPKRGLRPPLWKHPRRRAPRRGDQRGEPRTVPFFVASRMGVPGEGKTKSLPPGVLSLFSTFSLHEQRENGARSLTLRACTQDGRPLSACGHFPRWVKQGRAVEDASPCGVTSNSSINSYLSFS